MYYYSFKFNNIIINVNKNYFNLIIIIFIIRFLICILHVLIYLLVLLMWNHVYRIFFFFFF